MFLHVGPVLGVGWAGEAPFNIDGPGQCQCVSPGPVDSGHQLIRQLEKSSVNIHKRVYIDTLALILPD